MAYTAGDTITAAQYNIFVNNSSSPFGYNHFAGTGSGEYGLGQTHIPTVSAGAGSITASQWNTLLTSMDNIGNHTNDTLTSRTQVTAGDSIAIKAAVEADLASLAAEVAGGSTSATALGTNGVGASTNSGTWNSTSTITRSVTFASADKMRHFFNAGGKIRCTPSTSGSVDGDKDTIFSDLCTAIGNLDIGAHATTRSGSGQTQTTLASSTGFHDLGTSETEMIDIDHTNGSYDSNKINIFASLDAAVGSAVTINIKMVSEDPADDTTFTSGNTSGVPANPNEAPAMVLTLTEVFPTNAQGLSANIQSSSNAQVLNSAS